MHKIEKFLWRVEGKHIMLLPHAVRHGALEPVQDLHIGLDDLREMVRELERRVNPTTMDRPVHLWARHPVAPRRDDPSEEAITRYLTGHIKPITASSPAMAAKFAPADLKVNGEIQACACVYPCKTECPRFKEST